MKRISLIAAMGAAVLALAGCGGETETTGEVAEAEETNPAAACADDENIQIAGEIVFEGAVEAFPGDGSEIERMGKNADVSLTMAVLDGVDETTKRTNCSGRLVIGVPEEFQARFADESELTFDIEYSIQPSADGESEVIEVSEGYSDAVETIATAFLGDAAELAEPVEKEKPAPQAAKTYNPSFSCKGRLNFSEKAICEDATLSQLDRRMSQAYENALDYAHTPVAQRAIQQRQRAWIDERNSCGQNTGYECYVDSYNSRIAELAQ